jgi:hypothetical protein
MTQEPYVSAKRVFWVVDNGSSHAGNTSIARMHAAWPKVTLVHLPVHASWLNQIVRHAGRMSAAVLIEGGSTDVEGVVPGPVREDRPRLGVRRG